MISYTERDILQLEDKGISREQLAGQIKIFETGIPFVRLEKAAVIGDGIVRCTPAMEKQLIALFEKRRPDLDLLKFVPASGAASRMFKALFNFLDSYDPKSETLKQYIARSGDNAMQTFLEGLKDFPFYADVRKRIREKANGPDEEVYCLVQEMLGEDGLNYGNLPKGLLPFHKNGNRVSTPFEEHLHEAAALCQRGKRGKAPFYHLRTALQPL